MGVPIYLIDAFSSGPFTGNPAGVCLLERPVSEQWMQNLAMEMNQAETAFVWPLAERFSLRWFTPVAEVDLCGHATLASFTVLGREKATIQTRSGELTCKRSGNEIAMDFPAKPVHAVEVPAGLQSSLGLSAASFVGENGMDLLVEVGSEAEVRNLNPLMDALARIETRGVIVTARATGGDYDFVSRFFAPRFGIPEDPVTGSAHCALGPYWSERLKKSDVRGYQASRRGGYVTVRCAGERVELAGKATRTVEGTLAVEPDYI